MRAIGLFIIQTQFCGSILAEIRGAQRIIFSDVDFKLKASSFDYFFLIYQMVGLLTLRQVFQYF